MDTVGNVGVCVTVTDLHVSLYRETDEYASSEKMCTRLCSHRTFEALLMEICSTY